MSKYRTQSIEARVTWLGLPKGEEMPELDALQKTNLLFKFLTGEAIPDGIHGCPSPRLSKRKAWSIIWLLQEYPGLHLLPDHITICDNCGDLFDEDKEGLSISDCAKDYGMTAKANFKSYCGYCDDLFNQYRRKDYDK